MDDLGGRTTGEGNGATAAGSAWMSITLLGLITDRQGMASAMLHPNARKSGFSR